MSTDETDREDFVFSVPNFELPKISKSRLVDLKNDLDDITYRAKYYGDWPERATDFVEFVLGLSDRLNSILNNKQDN